MKYARCSLAFLLAMVLLFQAGCSGLAPLSTSHQPTLGRLAIVTVDRQVDFEFDGFIQSKGEGAATGAGSVFGECMGELFQGGCGGDFCGPAIILWLGVCSVAGAVGGAVGAAKAPPAQTVRAVKADIHEVAQSKKIQESLYKQIAGLALAYDLDLVSLPEERSQAASHSQDYSMLAADGVDTVLEVALTKAGTRGPGINESMLVYMNARVRLIQTADNKEILSAEYTYKGRRLTPREWSANQWRQMLRALEQGYDALGNHIFDSIFLLYPFPDRGPQYTPAYGFTYGLNPIEPSTQDVLSDILQIGRKDKRKSIDELRPTFQWQGFPRDTDYRIAVEDMGRIKNVRYDLIVATERDYIPDQIIYRRENLTDTTHKIQKTLKTDTKYFWTVRARFELDGRERVTEWGTSRSASFGRHTSPSPWSYIFITP